jgi:hypothetical protein
MEFAMRRALTLTAASLALMACSPAPGAEATAEPVDASYEGAADPTGKTEAQDPQAPQGIPADPDRPMGGGMREITPGGLTEAQFVERSLERFGRADANKDGVIDSGEMEAAGRGARRMARSDADGDGRVTEAEARSAAVDMFRRMDQNGDGRVTEDERPQR